MGSIGGGAHPSENPCFYTPLYSKLWREKNGAVQSSVQAGLHILHVVSVLWRGRSPCSHKTRALGDLQMLDSEGREEAGSFGTRVLS